MRTLQYNKIGLKLNVVKLPSHDSQTDAAQERCAGTAFIVFSEQVMGLPRGFVRVKMMQPKRNHYYYRVGYIYPLSLTWSTRN